MTFSNYLTVVRILMVPLMVLVFYAPFGWSHAVSVLVFAAAAATDWLDGYMARRLSETTKLGAFLDPVADKLLVVVTLVMLVGRFDAAIVLPALVIISREIIVSALRERMAQLGASGEVTVSALGKVKMGFQVAAIVVLLYAAPDDLLRFLGYLLMYTAMALTLWSMLVYMRDAWPALVAGDQRGQPDAPDDGG